VCSQDPYGRVAGLTRFVPLLFKTGTNAVDAAIAEIDIDVDTGMMVDPDGTILDIGPVRPETLEASLDLTVIKSGRTTGKTYGLVSAVDVTVDVAYNKQCGIGTQVARFVNQILIEPGEFSAGGDSGSLILSEQDGEFRPVGLLFAGSPGYTLANPIDGVLESLCVAMAGATSFPDPGLCDGGGGGGPPGKKPKPKKVPPGLERASEVKARHEQGLFGIASVVGTGVSFDEVGMPVIEVYMKRATPELVRKIPKALENISLRVVETGTFYAR
jgi:hypothetical protein